MSFFVYSPPDDDAPVSEHIKWMDNIDALRKSLLDESMILSFRLHWGGEYIETLPVFERKYAVKRIKQLVKEELEEIENIKGR